MAKILVAAANFWKSLRLKSTGGSAPNKLSSGVNMVNDYEQYEIDSERIRESNKELLKGFELWLGASKLAAKTIAGHIQNMDFYINDYLLYDDVIEPQDGIDEVSDFLGYWFIKKAMWASASSIKSNAASLKKFYTFLYEQKLVSKADLDSLKETIKDEMPDWIDTVARYDDPSLTDMEDVWGW
jgi:hypothetical protein